jgi:amidase
MGWDEWARHDAVDLAEQVRRGDITPAELAQQSAAGVALVNPALNAVVELFDDVVADPLCDGMNPAGPFAGVPYFMKDLGPTLKGRLQEMGSLLMKGHRPAADSFLTGQIRQAGLNVIGRTTTPEFGVCSSAENPAVYVTRNPWDLAYTTCGSSAGTAAMVPPAASMAALAPAVALIPVNFTAFVNSPVLMTLTTLAISPIKPACFKVSKSTSAAPN